MDQVTRKLLLQDHQIGITIMTDFGIDNEVYGNICQVRKKGGANEVCYSFDRFSHHYLMTDDCNPTGSMTTTRLQDGPIDCIQHYPMDILERFEHVIGSKCKFWIVDSSVENRLAAMRRMMTAVWKDQLSLGTRLDIINAKRDKVRFYQWMGYYALPGYDFIHPSLGTDSVVLLLSADPNWKSHFQPLFRGLTDPLPMARVLAEIDSHDRH